MPALQVYLKRIVEEHETLTRDEARQTLNAILTGETGAASDLEIGALLTAIAARGETVD